MATSEFPSDGEKWTDIMADVESFIMPGITHWQHPRCVRRTAPFDNHPPDLYGPTKAGSSRIGNGVVLLHCLNGATDSEHARFLEAH